jgi:hypothetical protein
MPKVSAFLSKTFTLLSESPHARWALPHENASFVITNPTAFAAEVLPRHFKHNNLNSFVRQLNLYGFHKSTSGMNIFFHHPQFMQSRPDLVEHIQLKAPKQPRPEPVEYHPLEGVARELPSKIPSDAESLVKENERLRRELERSENSKAELQNYITQLLTIIAVQNGSAGDLADGPQKRKRSDVPTPPTPSTWGQGSPMSPASPMSVASPQSDCSFSSSSSQPSSPIDMTIAVKSEEDFSFVPEPNAWAELLFPTDPDQFW